MSYILLPGFGIGGLAVNDDLGAHVRGLTSVMTVAGAILLVGTALSPAAAATAATASTGATTHASTSFFSGTVPAGGVQHWVWNNANPLTAVYEVALSPRAQRFRGPAVSP